MPVKSESIFLNSLAVSQVPTASFVFGREAMALGQLEVNAGVDVGRHGSRAHEHGQIVHRRVGPQDLLEGGERRVNGVAEQVAAVAARDRAEDTYDEELGVLDRDRLPDRVGAVGEQRLGDVIADDGDLALAIDVELVDESPGDDVLGLHAHVGRHVAGNVEGARMVSAGDDVLPSPAR